MKLNHLEELSPGETQREGVTDLVKWLADHGYLRAESTKVTMNTE